MATIDRDFYYIAVDVGTSSVRAAVVDRDGRILSFASEEIRIWQPSTGMYEQSSEDIWCCLCAAVRVYKYNIVECCNYFVTLLACLISIFFKRQRQTMALHIYIYI